jgi:hypothetical protein
LGLPEDLLPPTPHEIFDRMVAYAGTLRDGFDDATCGRMVRSTIKAYRPQEKDLASRIYNQVETGFSKVFFRRVFLRGGDKYKAGMMGVEPTLRDYALFAAASAYVTPQLAASLALQRIPVVGDIADQFLVRRIKQLLKSYGHAEYITDVSNYSDGAVAPKDNAVKPVFNRSSTSRKSQPAKVATA